MSRMPKKSETLEVRLPFETKTAFMARCRDDGRTASEAVRDFIDGEIGARGVGRLRLRPWQAAVAAIAGLAIGAVAAPSIAETTNASRPAFQQLDRNGDGALSFEEFSRRPAR